MKKQKQPEDIKADIRNENDPQMSKIIKNRRKLNNNDPKLAPPKNKQEKPKNNESSIKILNK